MNPETASILARIRQLPADQRLFIYSDLQKEFESSGSSVFCDDPGPDPIERVLLERIDGPFVPFEDDFFEKIKQESQRILAERRAYAS